MYFATRANPLLLDYPEFDDEEGRRSVSETGDCCASLARPPVR